MLTLTIWPLAASAGQNETLYLKGGDHMTGTSQGFSQGMLRWKLSEGEELSIPLDAIDRVEYPTTERLDSDLDTLLFSNEGEPDLVEPLPQPADEHLCDDSLHLLHDASDAIERSLDRAFAGCETWTKRFEVGGRFLDGNSNEDFIDMGGKFEQDKTTHSTQIEFGGQYGQSKGVANTNRWFSNGTMDFNTKRKWIFFLASKNEYDAFEELDYRGTFSAGAGYRFLSSDVQRLIVRIGPGVTYERFRNPNNNRLTPDVFGEVEFRTPLFERTELEEKTTLNPGVDNLDVIRIESNLGLLVHLDDSHRWSLKVGFRHEYESKPNDDRRPNDFTTSILLVYVRK